MIEDDCLLGFVMWRDNPRAFMRMRGTKVFKKADKQGLLLITLYTVDV